MRILSASAIHRGAIQCSIRNALHGPWSSFGHLVGKGIHCSSQCQPYVTISSDGDCITIHSEFQQPMALDRIYVKFNKCLYVLVCFPLIRNNLSAYNKPITGFGSFTASKYGTRAVFIYRESHSIMFET